MKLPPEEPQLDDLEQTSDDDDDDNSINIKDETAQEQSNTLNKVSAILK